MLSNVTHTTSVIWPPKKGWIKHQSTFFETLNFGVPLNHCESCCCHWMNHWGCLNLEARIWDMYCVVGCLLQSIWRWENWITRRCWRHSCLSTTIQALQLDSNVKLCLSMLQHITSFLKLEVKAFQRTLIVSSKVFFDNVPPPKPISRPFATNSRVSEPKYLCSSMDVVVGPYQRVRSSSGIPRWVTQNFLGNSAIDYFPLNAIQSLAKGPFQYKTSFTPSLAID